MTEQEPKQKKLIDQSETGDWVSQPEDLENSKKIPSLDVTKNKVTPDSKKEEIEKYGGYSKVEIEELYEGDTPHSDRGY